MSYSIKTTTPNAAATAIRTGRIQANELLEVLISKAASRGIPTNSKQHALEVLIDGDHLDSDETLMVSAVLFSGWQIGHADKLPDISLPALLDHFKTSTTCMQVVSEAGKAYRIDLASIVLGNEARRAPWAEKCSLNAYLLSDSFERQHSVSRCGNGDPVRIWERYFVNALVLCETVPSSLLAWAADDVEHASKVTCSLGHMRGKTQGWPWQDRLAHRRLPQFTEQVLRGIAAKHPHDVAVCFALAGALEDQGRFHEARVVIREFLSKGGIALEDECHLRHEALQIYRRELLALKKMDGTFDGSISYIEKAFRNECEELIEIARNRGLSRDSYLKTYALFEKDHGRADHALEVVEHMESRYQSQLITGMIRNDGRLFREGSPLYDVELAIENYIGAWGSLIEEKPDASPSQRLSVLYPLAAALHDAEYDGDAIDVCHYGLSLKNEPKLIKLLERMDEKPQVHVGDEVELPAILANDLNAEVSEASLTPDCDDTDKTESDALQIATDACDETNPMGWRNVFGILKRAS